MSNPKGRTKSLQFPLKMEINQNQAKEAFPLLMEKIRGQKSISRKKEAKKEWKEELFFPSPTPCGFHPLLSRLLFRESPSFFFSRSLANLGKKEAEKQTLLRNVWRILSLCDGRVRSLVKIEQISRSRLSGRLV